MRSMRLIVWPQFVSEVIEVKMKKNHITCSRHQSLQKLEFELTKSFVMIFLMLLQQTI